MTEFSRVAAELARGISRCESFEDMKFVCEIGSEVAARGARKSSLVDVEASLGVSMARLARLGKK